MAWIESHQELARHPKTKRLARQLGIGLPTAIGHLHCLWWWALDFAQDGDLDYFSCDELAEAALWEGESIPFLSALVSAGFIDHHADDDDDEIPQYQLHDWDDYAGKIIEQRKANARRQQELRDRRRNADSNGSDEDRNADITVTSPLRNGATVPNPTVPNRTQPNRTVPDSPLPPSRGAVRERAAPAYSTAFEAFWQAYPRRENKSGAWASWQKLTPAEAEGVMAGVTAWQQSDQWRRGIYPHAQTWLNRRQWEDEPVTQTTTQANGKPSKIDIIREGLGIHDGRSTGAGHGITVRPLAPPSGLLGGGSGPAGALSGDAWRTQ